MMVDIKEFLEIPKDPYGTREKQQNYLENLSDEKFKEWLFSTVNLGRTDPLPCPRSISTLLMDLYKNVDQASQIRFKNTVRSMIEGWNPDDCEKKGFVRLTNFLFSLEEDLRIIKNKIEQFPQLSSMSNDMYFTATIIPFLDKLPKN